MSPLAQIMEWLFITAWCVGVAAHIYASRFFLPIWVARFRKRPEHEGYARKAIIGYGIFIGAVAVGFAAGGIAELAGGWG
jgi:hypothetical protein